MQELHFKQQGDRAREKEYAQIYGIIMDLLDKMVSILGEEVVSPEEFRQLLETGMTQAKVGVDSSGNRSGSDRRYGENTSERYSGIVFCRG